MLRRLISTGVILFLFCIKPIHAQDRGTYREKFTEGNYLILEENYNQALKNFLEAYAIDSTNSNINYKVGFCYLKSSSQKNKATRFLEKACQNVTHNYEDMEALEKKAPENAYYYLAQAYHLDYRFDEAIEYFNKFKMRVGPKNKDLIADVDRRILICNNAKEFYAAPTKVDIVNLGDSVNSPYPDYSPVITADENMLIFTSRRPGSTGGEVGLDGQYFEDIYVAYRKKDGTWGMPQSIGANVNTAGNEASISLTPDGQQLFVYKDEDIYMSHLDGDTWSFPEPLGGDINSKAWETHACLSADQNTLYFVSDRKGGYGGRDIYKCVKLPNGKWSKASNLGPTINTEYDEDSPFIHPNKVDLFFSSRGHKTMGGFDIFFSTLNPDSNKWSEPINIGYPINTTDDDVFYVTSVDGKRAYYASARAGGYGDKDIYMIKLPEAATDKPVALIKGYITTADGSEIPMDIQINVTDKGTNEIIANTKPIHRTGSYSIILEPGKDYLLSYLVDGKEVDTVSIYVPPGSSYQEREIPLLLNNLTLTGNKVGTNKIGPAETDSTKTPKDKNPKNPKNPKDKDPKVKTPKDPVVHTDIHTDKEHEGPPKHRVTYYGGVQFRLYFQYNVHTIEPTDADFVHFMDTISATVKSKGGVRISIVGSASMVPTHEFKNNHELAMQRATDAKEEMLKALKAKGIDESKVEFEELKGEVNGPTYNSDYNTNAAMYRKYQYVKITFSVK